MCAGGPCGAAACAADGGCEYPSGTTCSAATCSTAQGEPAAISGGSCDGQGTCDTFTTLCGTYVCDANSATCLASCSDISGCAGTAFCAAGTCCPQLATDVYVNDVTGDDTACCGANDAPCLTLNHAMSLIRAQLDETGTIATFTLHPLVDGGGIGVWNGPESWPVVLDHGVALEAPDIDFPGPADGGIAFYVTDSDIDGGDGQGPVVIRGELGHPVILGYDLGAIWDAGLPDGGAGHEADGGVIPVHFERAGVGLLVDRREALVSNLIAGAAPYPAFNLPLWVSTQGTLAIGDGPVSAGWYPEPDGGGVASAVGSYDVIAWAQDGGTGMLISDETATGAGQLALTGGGVGLGILGGGSAVLTHSPIFGPAPEGGSCSRRLENGIYEYDEPVTGHPPSVELGGVTMQCLAGDGLRFISDGSVPNPDGGNPYESIGLVIDGGTFSAVPYAFECDLNYSAADWYLANLSLGASPCLTGLEGQQAFITDFGSCFGQATVDHVAIGCWKQQADLWNFDPYTGDPLGDLQLNDVTVTGIPDVGLSVIADTIEATQIVASGNVIGFEVGEGTLVLDGGQLTCNTQANLHVADEGVGINTLASVSNVIWNHRPPTACTASCKTDAGALEDGGRCTPCFPDAGFHDILLDDSTDDYSDSSPQLFGGVCP